MKKRFIKFHYKLLNPVLVFLAMLAFFIVIYGQDSEEIKGKTIARVVYSFSHALPGENIVIKRILTDSGKVITVSSSEEYRTIGDINYLKKKEEELVRQKYGAISQSLTSTYENMSDNDRIKVTIRFKNSVSKEQLQMLNLSDNCEIVDDYTATDSVSKSLLNSLKFNSLIYKIEEYREPIPMHGGDENCEQCGKEAFDSVYSGDAYSRSFYNFPEGVSSMPALGNGVRIATFEAKIASALFDSLLLMHPGLNIGYVDTVFDTRLEWSHNQMAFHAMLHTAPEAILNHYALGINPDTLIDSSIEVASKSSLGGGYRNSYDSLTYNRNSAIYCIGTGNFGLAFPPDWSSPFNTGSLWYNAIYIGGCIYTNNSYYEITNDEYYQIWQNDSIYLGTPRTHTQARNRLGSDKEVPHIVGPTRVTCTGGAEGGGVLHGFSGGSAAAPSLVGVCACVISANPVLMTHNTENVRTALMVTAENIDAGYWNPMVDGRDGCGVVSGYSAALFAQNVTRKNTSSAADTMGLAFSWINNTTPVGTRLKYNVRTPSFFPKDKHLRAVLTWSSIVNDTNADERILSDLNLELRDGSTGALIGQCYSFEDNHEVIDVENSELQSDHEYSLEIVIDSLHFHPMSRWDFIKYSLGWVWVNDFAGKKIEQATFSGDTGIEFYNRNIVFDTNTVFSPSSWSAVTAGNRIVLNPGVTIDSGAEFSASIVSKEIKYDAPPYSGSFIDHSGNRRHGQMPSTQILEHIIDRYCHIDDAGSSYFDGNDYLWVYSDTAAGVPKIIKNPKFYDGLTIAMWVRFYPDTNSTGYLFYSFDGDKGFYLHADDLGNYRKMITFHISDGSNSSEVYYITTNIDLVLDDDRPSNDWWLHITSVWRAGEDIFICINGERRTQPQSTNVFHCPSNPCYTGATGDTLQGLQAFKGCIDEVRLYIGADSEDHIESEYFKNTYPKQWKYDYKNVNVNVGADGFAHYDFTYDDIIDEEPPDTVNGGDSRTFKLPFNYNCIISAEPDPGKVPLVIKTRLSDNFIDTVNVPHNFWVGKGNAHNYRFDITFH